MKKILVVLLAAISFSSCKVLTTTTDGTTKFELIELSFGMPTATEQYTTTSPGPSGKHTYSADYKLDQESNTITGKLRNRFGVQYILKSKVNAKVPIKQIWIFPKPMTNEKGEIHERLEYTIEKPTNDSRWSTYKFDKEFEIVKGEWTFQVYYGDKKLHERKFNVI